MFGDYLPAFGRSKIGARREQGKLREQKGQEGRGAEGKDLYINNLPCPPCPPCPLVPPHPHSSPLTFLTCLASNQGGMKSKATTPIKAKTPN